MSKQNIVVLTGAGISAESGVKTFRDNNGLWENHEVEEVATPEAFVANPDLVYRFYNARKAQLLSGDVNPNPAHFALAELEASIDGNFTLVTQNVDNLHERAGSRNVIHMHGELLKSRCLVSNKVVYAEHDIDATSRCSCCQPAQGMRPHIVWFGEMPIAMEQIYEVLNQADVFISIGTSGNVYPAAGFVQEANLSGAHTIEINLEPSLGESAFAEKHYGKAGEILPSFVADWLADNA